MKGSVHNDGRLRLKKPGWFCRTCLKVITRVPILQIPWNSLCRLTGGRLPYICTPAQMLWGFQNTPAEDDMHGLIESVLRTTPHLIERLRPGQPEAVERLQYIDAQLRAFPGPRTLAFWIQEYNQLLETAEWISDQEAADLGMEL